MANSATLYARVDAALERVRPGILADGGDVWLINIDDDVAYVQLVGACGRTAAASAHELHVSDVVVDVDQPDISAVGQDARPNPLERGVNARVERCAIRHNPSSLQ